MAILQHWADSLQLFRLSKIRVFIKEVASSMRNTASFMARHFWWVLFLYVFVRLIPVFSSNKMFLVRVAQSMFLLQQLLLFALCVSVRSIMRKKYSVDFRETLYAFLNYIILFAGSLLVVGVPFLKYFGPEGFMRWMNVNYSVLVIFLILFFLDSSRRLKIFFICFREAVKMILFNLPLMIVLYAVMYFIERITLLPYSLPVGQFLGSFISHHIAVVALVAVLKTFGSLVFILIFVCTYAYIYFNRLENQRDLYNIEPRVGE